ncbi:hypothetical protein ACFWP5_09890 [Streptomyces sp. NPDC058469]|uniref:hypothetical protein n=1 Tax=Streptomyces sp. NPDC058469 TaxID=3346514 RepID=UPI003650231B
MSTALKVAGRTTLAAAFVDLLPRPLRERLVGSFTIDSEAATPADVKEKVRESLTGHAHAELPA